MSVVRRMGSVLSMVCALWLVSAVLGCKKDDNPATPDAAPMVDAAPRTYTVGGRAGNLLGSGLVLAIDGGTTLTVASDGTFTFPQGRMTGQTYAVTIATQPAGQTCVVRNGTGTVITLDITDILVTCPIGSLRITELSNCFFANTACWIEVTNTSTTETVQLSEYTLRSLGVPRTGGSALPQTFALPAYLVPPGGYVVLRGRASDVLANGRNLLHLLEGQIVPFWSTKGFVEVVKGGKTVDFVRLGAETTQATTVGWVGAGVATIPSSMVYGPSLARDLAMSDVDAAADWSIRAFATPGGRNDITLDTDADSDGIPDQAETAGGTFAGLDLYAMGVRTNQRDILLEIDRMTSSDPGVIPRKAALDKLVAAFAGRGIALHPDTGTQFSATFSPANYNLGGGNDQIPFVASVGMEAIYPVKALHMDVRMQAVAHYLVFVNEIPNAGGIAELGGNDLLVALGNSGHNLNTTAAINRLENFQASTIMHELGHNLGLDHGGNVSTNGKPNYLSVMNYLYAYNGMPTIGMLEGDRYAYDRCNIGTEAQLTNSPQTTTWILDYSNGSGGALNEAALDESAGLRRTGSTAVDFNCGGTIGASSFDTTGDGTLEVLNDHNDWANLELRFARTSQGAGLTAQPFADELRPYIVCTGMHRR